MKQRCFALTDTFTVKNHKEQPKKKSPEWLIVTVKITPGPSKCKCSSKTARQHWLLRCKACAWDVKAPWITGDMVNYNLAFLHAGETKSLSEGQDGKTGKIQFPQLKGRFSRNNAHDTECLRDNIYLLKINQQTYLSSQLSITQLTHKLCCVMLTDVTKWFVQLPPKIWLPGYQSMSYSFQWEMLLLKMWQPKSGKHKWEFGITERKGSKSLILVCAVFSLILCWNTTLHQTALGKHRIHGGTGQKNQSGQAVSRSPAQSKACEQIPAAQCFSYQTEDKTRKSK